MPTTSLSKEQLLPQWLRTAIATPVSDSNFEHVSSAFALTAPAQHLTTAEQRASVLSKVLLFNRKYGPSSLEGASDLPYVGTLIERKTNVSWIESSFTRDGKFFVVVHSTFAKSPSPAATKPASAARSAARLSHIAFWWAAITFLGALALLLFGHTNPEAATWITKLPPAAHPLVSALISHTPTFGWSVAVTCGWLVLNSLTTMPLQWRAWGTWKLYRHWSGASLWPLIWWGLMLSSGLTYSLGMQKVALGLNAIAGVIVLWRFRGFSLPLLGSTILAVVVLYIILALVFTPTKELVGLGIGLFFFVVFFGRSTLPLMAMLLFVLFMAFMWIGTPEAFGANWASAASLASGIVVMLRYTWGAYHARLKRPPAPTALAPSSVALADNEFDAVLAQCKAIREQVPPP